MLTFGYIGEKEMGVLDAAPPAVFVPRQSFQCFTTPLISFPLYRSHVLTLYGDVQLLCNSSKEDVPALKPIFIACWPFLETCWDDADVPRQGEAHFWHSLQSRFREMKHSRLQSQEVIVLRKTNRGSKHKHGRFKSESVWCGSTALVSSSGRGTGQAGCDW